MKNRLLVISGALLLLLPCGAFAQRGQRGGQRGGGPPVTAKAGAAVDLTGYWISVVSEDWQFRMITPPKGVYTSVPLNAEGKKVADTWDPAKDEAAGNQCKAYGAAAIMRVPTRLHITWENPETLKIETDAGTRPACCTSAFCSRRPARSAGKATRKPNGRWWLPGAAAADRRLLRKAAP